MLFWKVRTDPFSEAKTARKSIPVFLTMLLAALLFVGFRYSVEFLIEQLFQFVQKQVALYKIDGEASIFYDMDVIIRASATAILILLASLYVRFLEGRRLSTMGFHKEGLWRNLFKGILVGILLFGAMLGMLVFSGNYKMEGELRTDLLARIVGIASVWICGFSFEYFFRGFVLSSLGARSRFGTAVFLTAVLSTAAQSYYWGYSILSIFNNLLFDMLLGLLVVRTGSAFAACTARASFLFVCQFVFGTVYSGAVYTHAFVPTTINYSSLWVGTANGIDNGYTFAIILGVALLLLLFLPKKMPEEAFETGPFIKHVPVEKANAQGQDTASGKSAKTTESATVLRRPSSIPERPAQQSEAEDRNSAPDDEENWEEEESRAHVEPAYKKPEDYLK